jgi:predicted kinase
VEAVIFVGLPAAGKSTFYRERFATTHVRINRDSLDTRSREMLILEACLELKRPFVADDTNASPAERAAFIGPARKAGFRVTGYWFVPDIAGSVRRNKARAEGKVPRVAIFTAHKRLRPPAREEGFDALFTVTIDPRGRFAVEEWTGQEAPDRPPPAPGGPGEGR